MTTIRVKRKNTIIIDCHQLGFKPKTTILHELLFDQYKLLPSVVQVIEIILGNPVQAVSKISDELLTTPSVLSEQIQIHHEKV